VIAWLRGVLCEMFGHRTVALRRITPDYGMRTVYQCERCGMEQ